jgi:hypothetical protein
VAASVHGSLQHLILDDYQDVNPAQWGCPALTDRADDSVRLPS